MEQLERWFPFWQQLKEQEKELIAKSVYRKQFHKGMVIHRSENLVQGLIVVLSGQMRTYILSDEGREVTLYRVGQDEICVLAASRLMDTITFDVMIEAAETTEILVLPTSELEQIMKGNPLVEIYLYKAATAKFSDVMWSIQQILFQRIDQRVARFLWDEMLRKDSTTLELTHDEVAKHIGSAREVVSKVLKYLSQEKIVEVKRGSVHILDKEKLKQLLM